MVTGERSDFGVDGEAGAEERPDHSAGDIGGGFGCRDEPVEFGRRCRSAVKLGARWR